MAEQTKKRLTTTDDETSKTSANPKKKKQIRRSDESKQPKKQSDRQQGKTRVSIGAASPRWRALREENGLRGDTHVALFLLDWCDGKRVCEINTNAFHSSDPCVGTYKYLESTYTCFPATHIVACEHSLANLKCNGWQVIIVYGAYYGRRDRTTCSYQRPFYQTLNARCSNPTSKVAESCNGKSSCDIKVSNSVFGDPCAFTYKYLEVVYGCHYWFRLAA